MSTDKGTEGEQFVHRLADRSYLSHWCFPNPSDEEGDKKEIVDLLIWLDDTLILISIKNYEFKGNHERYHRKTIEKAVRQIQGAERKLFHSNRDVVVKHPTRGMVKILTAGIMQVIRLVANLGEGEEYYEAARKTGNDQFISIINKDTVETFFNELDTIKDIVRYFVEREKMFRSLDKIMLQGREKDLLATYLTNARKMPDIGSASVAMFDIEGAWDNFISDSRKIARDKENRKSYFIDELVKRELAPIQDGWVIAEPLMLLSRLERRMFAKAFFEKYDEFRSLNPQDAKDVLLLKRYQKIGDIGFTFLFYQERYDGDPTTNLLKLAMYAHGIHDGFASRALWAIATNEELNRFHFAFDPNPHAISEADLEAIEHDLSLLRWNKSLEPHFENMSEFPETKSS